MNRGLPEADGQIVVYLVSDYKGSMPQRAVFVGKNS